VDFTLGLGSPDPDLSGAVSPAGVYLRRSTVVSEVSPVMKNHVGPSLFA